MSDTREALADVFRAEYAKLSPGQYPTGRALIDAILAEFLVVPRSEVRTEYGVEYRGLVHGDIWEADIARFRARHIFEFDRPASAVRRRQVWQSEWAPLPEDGGQQ